MRWYAQSQKLRLGTKLDCHQTGRGHSPAIDYPSGARQANVFTGKWAVSHGIQKPKVSARKIKDFYSKPRVFDSESLPPCSKNPESEEMKKGEVITPR